MKHIGRTKDHNPVVELTQTEFNILVSLQIALEGRPHIDLLQGRLDLTAADASKAFQAIATWTQAQFLINDMAEYLDKLRKMLGSDQELIEYDS
jgi:hypothetical protein